MGEQSPRTDSSKPNEDRQIEKHINRGLQRVVERLEAKPIVPGKGISSNEASQYVVAAYHATSSNDKECQCNGEDQEALPVDKLFFFSPVKELLSYPTDCRSIYDAENDRIAPCFAEPPCCPSPPSPVYLMR
jgi:hypothetical protein